jgi:hypothetical protein
LFFVFSHNLSAQSKPHFVINNAGSPQAAADYAAAIKDFDFDAYRFYDQRRTIKFAESNVTIELYSAKELLDLYGKPLSPLTLMNNKPTKLIEFIYFPADKKAKIRELN